MNKSQETKKKPAHGVYTGRAGSIDLFIFTDRIIKSRSGEYSYIFNLGRLAAVEYISSVVVDSI